MTKRNRLAVIAAIALTVAGCKGDQKATGGTADGEILPGSASDAMLPIDNVRSQAPLAPHSDGGTKSKDSAAAASSPGEAAAPTESSAPTEPAPAPPPDPAATAPPA